VSTVRQGPDAGDERPTGSTLPKEATGVERLTVLKGDNSWGWTTLWVTRQVEDLSLVLIPKLRIEPSPTFQLVHVRSLLDVFKDCTFQFPDRIQPVPFCIYGGTFMLYKTGCPELHNVITALGGSSGDLAKIIRLGTEALT
jgi:hypothetical protein